MVPNQSRKRPTSGSYSNARIAWVMRANTFWVTSSASSCLRPRRRPWLYTSGPYTSTKVRHASASRGSRNRSNKLGRVVNPLSAMGEYLGSRRILHTILGHDRAVRKEIWRPPHSEIENRAQGWRNRLVFVPEL